MDDDARRVAASGALGAIGLDIGGTKIAVGLVTGGLVTGGLVTGGLVTGGLVRGSRASLVYRATAPTRPELGADGVLESADRLVEGALEAARSEHLELTGLGIAVPELVDPHGEISSAVVVDDLRQVDLRARYGALGPVVVESDVRAAAVAESRLGAGRRFESFGYVSVGTGVSHCLVIGGVPWRGSRGAAILLGSSVMAEWREGDRLCRWVLEEIASGPALLRRYRSLGGPAPTVRAVLDAHGTDPIATAAVDQAARALGIGLATLVNMVDPEGLVIGGGLGTAPGPHFDLAVSAARDHIYAERARDIEIVRAECGADSGVLGAALLALGHARAGTGTGP